jgi:hypothetical protein
MVKYLICILLLTIESINVLYAQKDNKIYGVVINKKTKEPVPNVNVFISQTTIGTATNEDGFYEVNIDINGFHELIFSHINYFPVVKPLKIEQNKDFELSLEMTEKVIKLNNVVIKSSEKEWKRNLFLFKREFLGQTPNASSCKILNPWILEFNYNSETGKLEAGAEDELVIENNALGYKISYLLESFEHHQDTLTRYSTKTKFEELHSENHAQEERWIKRREKAFLGSYQHFIRILDNAKLIKEGYEVLLCEIIEQGDTSETHYSIKKMRSRDIMYDTASFRKLQFKGALKVAYKDVEEHSYKNFTQRGFNLESNNSDDEGFSNHFKKQTSFLEVIAPNGCVVVDSGTLRNSLFLQRSGHWSWKRTADWLPLNYSSDKEER